MLGQLGYLITLLFYHNHPPIVKKPITETSDEVNRAGGWRYVVPLSSLVVEPDIEHHTVYTYSVDFSAPRPGGEIEDDMDSTTHQIRTLCNPSLPCIVVMGNY